MKTAEEIFEEMKAVFAEKSGYEIADDCDMAVRMMAFASQAEALYIYGSWVTRQSFPQTAEGEYLDSHARSRGLIRRQGSRAYGDLTFFVNSAAVSDILVPKGTVCMTSSGVSFETLTDVYIPEGENITVVAVQALEEGRCGNVQKRTVTFMTNAPVGVEGCVNALAFTGGEDAESDEELRARVLASFKAVSNGANAAWYEKNALETGGVAAVSVVPCARGVGTVDVIITAEGGMPDDALIARVQSEFESKREICVDVQVKAPSAVYMDITAEVKVKAGYDAQVVLNNVKTVLEDMFDGSFLARKLYTAEIGDKIYHVDGVESYRLSAPTYDSVTPENVLLCAGEITISRWE